MEDVLDVVDIISLIERMATYNSGVVEESLQLRLAEVGHTESLNLAGLKELLHGLVGLDKVGVTNQSLLAITIGVPGESLRAALEGRGPVHVVEVDVVDVEELERVVEGLLDVLGVVHVVPQLGGQEDLLARHARVADALADGLLGAVHGRRVDVAVAVLQGEGDGLLLLVNILPCSETDSWDARSGGKTISDARSKTCSSDGQYTPSVELESGSLVRRRHVDLL